VSVISRLLSKIFITSSLFFIVIVAASINLYASEQEEFLRGPNGKPDLNGVWQVLNSANYNLEAHSASASMAMIEGPVVPIPHPSIVALGTIGSVPAGLGVVEGGTIPYKRQALKTREENKKNWVDRDPEIKCYLPGVPRATYMSFPFQIFHSEKAIFFAYEYAGAVRNIYLEDPGPAPVDSWMGQSWGYWEDDTLVIEVTGFNGQTWFDRSGNFHSDQLKVIEKYTLINNHTMKYEATIEDEKVFTKPWKISMNLYKRVGKDAQLQQFKCVEFVEELFYGQWRGN
tara:strand:- start:696 stop:1553 length:858 start_codon:yes stop_codon:yes gene_type:complete